MKTIHFILLVLTPLLFTSALTPNQWHDDLDYLKRKLPQLHKNAFHTISKAQFHQSVDNLKEKSNHLIDIDMAIELSRLMASIGDAHTSMGFANDFYLYKVPIAFKLFDDGLYLTKIDSCHKHFLKQRIVSINQLSVDSVCKVFASLIPHENEYWLREQLPSWLGCPQVYRFFGMSSSSDSITFGFDNGQSLTLGIASKTTRYASFVPPYKNLLSTSPRKNYWCEKFDNRVYIQYNKCRIDTAYPFHEFVDDVIKCFDDSTQKVVIDLRLNGGGNSFIIQSLIQRLKKQKKSHPFTVYACIGNHTYSSGVYAATDLQRKLGAVLIGEPTGGSPYSYGDIRNFILPNSKLVVNYSVKFFDLNHTHLNTVYPDIEIKTSASQYFRGVDPVLSYVKRN